MWRPTEPLVFDCVLITCSAPRWVQPRLCSPASFWPLPGSPARRLGLQAHRGQARRGNGTATLYAQYYPTTSDRSPVLEKDSCVLWWCKHFGLPYLSNFWQLQLSKDVIVRQRFLHVPHTHGSILLQRRHVRPILHTLTLWRKTQFISEYFSQQ